MELKELYRPDALLYTELGINIIYWTRDIYKDLVKLYGKKHVARTSSDIDENTICYIGTLVVEKTSYI